jgi:hypothetical protein
MMWTSGLLHTGDTLAYVCTLTAEGTTHGFERGCDAFLGDPFGVDIVSNNLGVTVLAGYRRARGEYFLVHAIGARGTLHIAVVHCSTETATATH